MAVLTPRVPRPARSAKSGAGSCLTARSGAPGADEATLLTTEQPIVLGGTDIPAGTYSLFTLPAADGTAKLIVNKQTGQWGIPYKEQSEATNELARIDLKKDTLDKTVDQFTMAIEPNPAGGGMLKMMWENTGFSVPFTVKK